MCEKGDRFQGDEEETERRREEWWCGRRLAQSGGLEAAGVLNKAVMI